jgi:hypothetical protein
MRRWLLGVFVLALPVMVFVLTTMAEVAAEAHEAAA